MTPSSWQGRRNSGVWQSKKRDLFRKKKNDFFFYVLPTRPRGLLGFLFLFFKEKLGKSTHTHTHTQTRFSPISHTHTLKTRTEDTHTQKRMHTVCSTILKTKQEEEENGEVEEDTDLSGIRVWRWRFSIHKLRAKFRYVVAGTIGPASIRLLLRNHGAAVARRRRGASSALSFSHLRNGWRVNFLNGFNSI